MSASLEDCFNTQDVKEADFSVFVSPTSAQRAAMAAGGLPRAHPADVHGPGAHPDEAGLQHEGRD